MNCKVCRPVSYGSSLWLLAILCDIMEMLPWLKVWTGGLRDFMRRELFQLLSQADRLLTVSGPKVTKGSSSSTKNATSQLNRWPPIHFLQGWQLQKSPPAHLWFRFWMPDYKWLCSNEDAQRLSCLAFPQDWFNLTVSYITLCNQMAGLAHPKTLVLVGWAWNGVKLISLLPDRSGWIVRQYPFPRQHADIWLCLRIWDQSHFFLHFNMDHKEI